MPQADEGSRADIIPLRAAPPEPINFQVIHDAPGGRPETIIARTWRVEDVHACRLCARCTATASRTNGTALCLRKFYEHVPVEEAALFRDAAGLERVGRPDQRHGTVAG